MAAPTIFLVAAPDAAVQRIGAKFRVESGTSLLVGGSPKARIPVAGGSGGDVELHFDEAQGLTVRRAQTGPTASLGGAALPAARVVPWPPGATLVVDGAWALALQPLPPAVDRSLELRLAQAPDDSQAWAVYRDALLERGSWVGAFLATPPTDDAARLAALGALASSVTAGVARVDWGPQGLVRALRLHRAALVEPPGAAWHLRALAAEPALRCLTSLAIEAFVGQQAPPGGVDAAAAELLDTVRALPCAPFLRALCLGYVELATAPLTAAAEARLRSAAPALQSGPGTLVHLRPAAFLQLVSTTEGRGVVGLAPGERRRVNAGRTVIGTEGVGAHLRVVGLPPGRRLATLVDAGGQWTVAADGEPARLLLPDDEFEAAGLRLRFVFAADT